MGSVLGYFTACTCSLFSKATSCFPSRAQDTPLDDLKTHDAASRLCTLCKAPPARIVEYIAYANDKEDRLTAELFSRILLEHIYAKNWSSIHSRDPRNLIIRIHPDKHTDEQMLYKAMFQLHDDLLKASDFAGEKRSYIPTSWVYHKIFGWYYHRQIRAQLHPTPPV